MRKTMPCSRCGEMMWRSKKSTTSPVCHPCRRARPEPSKHKVDVPCARCGTLLTQRQKAAKQRFCSMSCAKRAEWSGSSSRKPTSVCLQCGEHFVAKWGSGKFCSRECAFIGRGRAVSTPFACVVPWTTCDLCGASFVGRARYCSQRCRETKVAWRVFITRCVDCHNLFTHRAPQSIRCDPCRSLHKWRTATRWKKASKLLPFVAHRDRWVCGICNQPVESRQYRPDDIWSPTVDHVVPISLGGSDEPENLRLAHMICNSVRGNDVCVSKSR